MRPTLSRPHFQVFRMRILLNAVRSLDGATIGSGKQQFLNHIVKDEVVFDTCIIDEAAQSTEANNSFFYFPWCVILRISIAACHSHSAAVRMSSAGAGGRSPSAASHRSESEGRQGWAWYVSVRTTREGGARGYSL